MEQATMESDGSMLLLWHFAAGIVAIMLVAAIKGVFDRITGRATTAGKLKMISFPLPGPSFSGFLDVSINSKMTESRVKWVENYGEVFSVVTPFPLSFLMPHRVVVADVTVCKDLLIKEANMYRSPSNFSSRSPDLASATRMSVGTSVTGLVGEEWKWRKEALLKEFHRARMMSSDRGLLEAVLGAGEELCCKLDHAANTGEVVMVDVLMTRCAVKVILFFLFGRDLDFDAEQLAAAAKDLMDFMVHTFIQPGHGFLKHFPGKSRRQEEKKLAAWNVFDKVVADEIDIILQEHSGTRPVASDRKPGSVLASLIEKEPRFCKGGIASIKAEARVFILAGFETTAHSLSFALGLLAEYPSLADKLSQEVNAASGGTHLRPTEESLKYTLEKTPTVRNFFLEAIRLFPLAPALGGYCTNNVKIATRGGDQYILPQKTNVTFANMVMQRHPDFAKGSGDPNTVEPERWDVPVAEQPFLNTFNTGAHVCPGKNLSLLEGHIFLIMVCTRFRFEFPDGVDQKVAYAENMLLRPKDGMPLVVKRCVT